MVGRAEAIPGHSLYQVAGRDGTRMSTTTTSLVLCGCISVALVTVAAQSGSPKPWWAPGQGTSLPELSTYDNDRGQLGVLNASGQLDTKGHPFFEPIGTNGRACVTCHQPADAMSLSVRSIRERWAATAGSDPCH